MAAAGQRSSKRASDFILYAGGVTAVVLALAVLVAVFQLGRSDKDRSAPPSSADATTAPGETAPTTAPTSSTSVPQDVSPTDRVGYITADGTVMSGLGATAPVAVATGAALGENGRGAMSIAPTGDLIAFIRTDGAVVTVAVEGGEQRVIATDASLDHLGRRSSLSWDPVASRIAYLAVGTQEMVEPRPDEPEPLSGPGAFRAPLPEGVLGAVVKIVDRDGKLMNRLGDPSLRSMTGITYSSTDDVIVLESENPETHQPFTLATAGSTLAEVKGSVLSADDPAFSPDGNFILAVGPQRERQELVRLSTETFSRTVLTSDERICNPVVSPDSTRVAYGAGPDCSKLMLISSRGGSPVDISPPPKPGQATFAQGRVAWTQDGHFLVYSDCRIVDGTTSCGGPVSFFDPDRNLLIPGIAATTVGTVSRPLIQDMTVHVAMEGPIVYEGEFPVDIETQAELSDVSRTASILDVTLADGERSLTLKLNVDTTRSFSSGTMKLVDPEKGIDRTFLVTGSATLIGVRVASLSGIWISNSDLPFSSGEFRLSVVRGN